MSLRTAIAIILDVYVWGPSHDYNAVDEFLVFIS